MKSTVKKLLSVLLAAILIFGFAAASAGSIDFADIGIKAEAAETFTEGYYTYSVADGEATISKVDTSISGDVTIPSILGGYPVTRIYQFAFNQCTKIKNIVVPNGITKIEVGVFQECTNMETISLSEGITAIEAFAFNYCKRLTTIEIPKGTTYIGEAAFLFCDNLKSIILPNSLIFIEDSAFNRCDNLTDIYFNGTENQWNYLKNYSIYDNNVPLLTANVHINSPSLYTITWNISGGEWSDGSTDNIVQTYEVGAQITVPYSPTREGYTFLGWMEENNNSIPGTMPNTNLMFSALWSPNEYLILWNIRGEITEEYITYFAEIIPPEVTAPKGYKFVGWSPEVPATMPAQELYFDAVFEKIEAETYTVTWFSDGTTLTTQKYEIGAKITPPANPTKSGYIFKGWDPAVPETMPEKDMTFTAVFEKAVYNVTWVVDGAKTTHKYEFGAEITPPADPAKSGYFFKGWSPAVPATMPAKNLTFTAVFEKISEKNIYNLGEETYSFGNYGDEHSPGGHCFGMSVTSSGYYTGDLDVTEIGIASSDKLYTATDSEKVKEPICHYQEIQGSPITKSIVAGGKPYKSPFIDVNSDWTEMVNYVKNHEYDNRGSLIVLSVCIEGDVVSGHAVNFLYYSNVNGQDRIYLYDNNFPETPTYFYKDTSGKIKQAPVETFAAEIDTVAFLDVEAYLNYAGDFDFTHTIYAYEGEISVEGVNGFPMFGTENGKTKYVYEIPDTVSDVKVIPLVDDAEFTYLSEEYSFGKINNTTFGEFKLATINASGESQEPGFNIVNAEREISVSIKAPSTTTISYGDSIILHADVENLPESAYIEWTADNGNFTYTASADGTTCTVSPSASGDTTFTATVYDADGNEIGSDTQTMTAKAGLWQKIVSFFKNLFGISRIIEQVVKF